MGDFKQRRLAAAPRVLHPSEDLSELPPLRSVVAGQVYHYRLAGSSQNSLPKPLLAGWVRSSPYWAVFMQKQCLPHRWSSRIRQIAVPFLAHPLDVMSVTGYVLFKLHECCQKYLSPLIRIRDPITQTFFKFSRNFSFAKTAPFLLCNVMSGMPSFLAVSVALQSFEEKHINELPLIL